MITPSFSLTATERVLPKLALDFTTASLDPRVTFTRTTNATNPATYVNSSGYVTAATNDQPRFDYDPITLTCRGLLIEESRSNILEYSQLFDAGGGWTTTASSIVSSTDVPPSNIGTSVKLVEDNTSNRHYINRTKVSLAAGTYTYTVYAKALSANRYLQMTEGASTANRAMFNLNTGTVASSAGSPNATITPAGNGWYRCRIQATLGSGQSFGAILAISNTTGTSVPAPSYQGDGTSAILIWGAQLELGAFETSYIPTEATVPVTRDPDQAIMTGTNFSDWYTNPTDGSVVVQYTNGNTLATSKGICSISTNAAANRIDIYTNSTSTYFDLASGGSVVASKGVAGAGKAAVGIATNNAIMAVNSTLSTADTSCAAPISPTQMQIGRIVATNTYFNGWIQKINYFPQRLTNAELQAFSK